MSSIKQFVSRKTRRGRKRIYQFNKLSYLNLPYCVYETANSEQSDQSWKWLTHCQRASGSPQSPPANLKGKGNPDLPWVCSNYWPPIVALSLCYNHKHYPPKIRNSAFLRASHKLLKLWSTKSAKTRHLCTLISAQSLHCVILTFWQCRSAIPQRSAHSHYPPHSTVPLEKPPAVEIHDEQISSLT